MQKTNTTKSPLLKPVIERDYTKGINFNISDQSAGSQSGSPEPDGKGAVNGSPGMGAGTGTGAGSQPGGPAPGQKFNMPPDQTKEFSFDDIPEGAGDINDSDHSDGMNITGASAKAFANFAGDAIQMYLPRLTYGYCKVDMDNVVVNIEKGTLTLNWLDTFERINKGTEEALQISDDAIKMWKKAFKDYLESENMSFANPKTAFILATIVLLADQGVKAYQIRKSNEDLVRQAIEASNPGRFAKERNEEKSETSKTEFNGKADSKAA